MALFEKPHAVSRTNKAVEQRLGNIHRRLVAARIASTLLAEDQEWALKDIMDSTIDRLNAEVVAWQQWQLEGFKSPALDKIREQLAEMDFRNEQRNDRPQPEFP